MSRSISLLHLTFCLKSICKKWRWMDWENRITEKDIIPGSRRSVQSYTLFWPIQSKPWLDQLTAVRPDYFDFCVQGTPTAGIVHWWCRLPAARCNLWRSWWRRSVLTLKTQLVFFWCFFFFAKHIIVGVYFNSMHPSIITMYTVTHSLTFLYIMHFYVSPNKVTYIRSLQSTITDLYIHIPLTSVRYSILSEWC